MEAPPSSGAATLARLDAIAPGAWHVRMRAAIGITMLLDGFDGLMLSLTLPVIAPLWRLTPGQIGFIISATFLGQAIGAILFGRLAERYGRMPAIRASILLFSLASLASAVAGDYYQLLAFRLVAGVGLGGEVPVASTYVSEFAPTRLRGRFFMLFLMTFSFGQLLASLAAALLIPRMSWRVLMMIGALPVLLVPFLGRFCPESPRWLVSRGRHREANAIIDRIIAGDRGATTPAAPGEAMPAIPQHSQASLLALVYRRRTLTVWALWFVIYATLYGLQGWLPVLYRKTYGLSIEQTLYLNFIAALFTFLANLLCAFTLDRVERRTWFVGALFLAAGLLAAAGMGGARTVAGLVLLAWPALAAMATVATSLYLYTAEIYPTTLRARGIGAASVWVRIGAVIAPLVVARIVIHGGLASVFGVSAICAGLCLAACLFGEVLPSRGRAMG